MTYLFNQPSAFAAELIEGFVAANADKVRQVSGGVVRSTRSQPDTVAVIVGGGSGHYPAFAGLVGQGLAHGAAMGNLFASPSAQQIYNVARARITARVCCCCLETMPVTCCILVRRASGCALRVLPVRCWR